MENDNHMMMWVVGGVTIGGWWCEIFDHYEYTTMITRAGPWALLKDNIMTRETFGGRKWDKYVMMIMSRWGVWEVTMRGRMCEIAPPPPPPTPPPPSLPTPPSLRNMIIKQLSAARVDQYDQALCFTEQGYFFVSEVQTMMWNYPSIQQQRAALRLQQV